MKVLTKEDFNQKKLYETVIVPLLKLYPEVTWFADPNVAATKEVSSSSQTVEQSWTKFLGLNNKIALTDKKYIELERMLQSIICLYLIHNGTEPAYLYWIKSQTKDQLKLEEFNALHQLLNDLTKEEHETYKALEAHLVFSDLGKTPEAKKRANQFGINHADHDDFMDAVYTAAPNIRKEIIPSFETLSTSIQAHILALHRAVPLHWGHAIHLEGGIGLFQRLKTSQATPNHVLQAYLMQVCDVGASAAHINPVGAMAFNHTAYLGYQSVLKNVQLFLKEKDPKKVLNQLILDRKSWLNLNIDTSSPKGRVICRIAAFLRFYKPEEGLALKETAEITLQKADWELLTHVFGMESGVNIWVRNPTYMTTVLLNLLAAKPADSLTLKCTRVWEGALVIAQICEQYQRLNHYTSTTPLCFNPLAGLAQTNPDWFSRDRFEISMIDFKNPQAPLLLEPFFQHKIDEEDLTNLLSVTNLDIPRVEVIMSYCFHNYIRPSLRIQPPTTDNPNITVHTTPISREGTLTLT